MRLPALAILVASIVAYCLFAGQALASGSAAHDQYTPPSVPSQHESGTPPGAQASGPIAAPTSGGATLPFTGLSLLRVVLLGIVLLVLGILLRRGVPRRGP